MDLLKRIDKIKDKKKFTFVRLFRELLQCLSDKQCDVCKIKHFERTNRDKFIPTYIFTLFKSLSYELPS